MCRRWRCWGGKQSMNLGQTSGSHYMFVFYRWYPQTWPTGNLGIARGQVLELEVKCNKYNILVKLSAKVFEVNFFGTIRVIMCSLGEQLQYMVMAVLPVHLGGIDGLKVLFFFMFFFLWNCLLTSLELSGSSNCFSFCWSFIIMCFC